MTSTNRCPTSTTTSTTVTTSHGCLFLPGLDMSACRLVGREEYLPHVRPHVQDSTADHVLDAAHLGEHLTRLNERDDASVTQVRIIGIKTQP